jgi:hypothetical protein
MKHLLLQTHVYTLHVYTLALSRSRGMISRRSVLSDRLPILQ